MQSANRLSALLILAIATLCMPCTQLAGQRKIVSSPAGYVTKEGEQHSSFIGAHAQQRVQIGDGNLRGKPITLTRVSFRHDYWDFDLDHGGLGRSWTQVQLAVADTDLSRFDRTWTVNWRTSPTRVFQARVSWPTLTGLPKGSPSPFSSSLSFPFQSSYAYKGTADLLLDFTFSGGTLVNQKGWTTNPVLYYLDSANQGSKAGMRLKFFGDARCKDSSQQSAALSRVGAEVTSAGMVTFSLASQWTAPNKPVIQAIGLLGSTGGTGIGACNKLHITPVFFVFATAGAGSAFSFTFFPAIPYNRSFSVPTLWSQAAFEDSRSRNFMLTRAARGQVPLQPGTTGKVKVVEVPQLNTATGNGPYQDHTRAPLLFFN